MQVDLYQTLKSINISDDLAKLVVTDGRREASVTIPPVPVQSD